MNRTTSRLWASRALQAALPRYKLTDIKELLNLLVYLKGLKNLARELKIPVLCVSQLSRAVESRGSRRPQLADLRESGAIEQDADVVMFIYREDAENMKDTTLDIQKHRNGPTGEIKLMFIPEKVKFYGMERGRGRPPKEESDGKES